MKQHILNILSVILTIICIPVVLKVAFRIDKLWGYIVLIIVGCIILSNVIAYLIRKDN